MLKKSLYGIITVVMSTYIIDKMMLLGQNNIQVIVVSEHYEEIAERLMKDGSWLYILKYHNWIYEE